MVAGAGQGGNHDIAGDGLLFAAGVRYTLP
jgi:hypothetical protein